jgi:predicted molibdopterin-dependent oxidoreductase YjgC
MKDRPMSAHPLLTRLAEQDRPPVSFRFDGQPFTALAGDSVLTAVLSRTNRLRLSEFSRLPRAGFCMMGACQDCWVATAEGERLRACSTPVLDGMDLVTLNGQAAGAKP